MDFTKEQLSEVLCKHAERENGLQDLMEIMIESMMVAERREYLREDGLPGDKGNGFRMGHTYQRRMWITGIFIRIIRLSYCLVDLTTEMVSLNH